MTQSHLSLPETASRLAISWPQAWRLVLTGALVGTKVAGRWLVEEASVIAFERRRSREKVTNERLA